VWCGNWGLVTGRISSICARPGEICTNISKIRHCLCISSLIPRPSLGWNKTLLQSKTPLCLKQADGITRQNVLKLSHPGKRPYFFQLPNSYDFERWYGVLSEILRWQLTSTDSTPVNSWKLEIPLDCCYESNYTTDKTGNENSHLYTTIEQVTNLRKNTQLHIIIHK